MAIKNYTTSIDFYKTIGEIQQRLSKAGATKIVIDNNADRLPVALTFAIPFKGTQLLFSLPCRHQKLLKVLEKDRSVTPKLKTEEQALRVSWRIIKDWVDAQLALVEVELVDIQEVFFPYIIGKDGQPLYNKLINDNSKLLIA